MKIDPFWRQRIDALRRAGLTYVARDRLEMKTIVEPPVIAEPDPSPSIATDLIIDPIPSIQEEVEVLPVRSKSLKKEAALEALAAQVAQCTQCSALCSTRTQTVFGDGTPHAEICFVGEAPGADEDAQGVPFVGKAGQLLTKIIEACKLQRNEVYICNVLKCRPPGNRNPMPDEVENCRPFLEKQLQIVQPKMMVALGKIAAAYLLNQKPENTPILKLRGSIREYCGIPFMITLHPAYLLRNPAAKRDVWEDMKTVMREIGRPVD